jgi:hypothetical protein
MYRREFITALDKELTYSLHSMSSTENFWLCYVSAYGTLNELKFLYTRVLKIFSLIFILTITRCTVKKKVSDLPVHSRDVIYQTFPGRE